jgi:hypothetical protein
LVIAQTSKTQQPVRITNKFVYDQKLVVFASGSCGLFGVLSSSIHRLWAAAWGSTMRADTVYTPSDVFETFPIPEPSDELDSIGQTLDTERREIASRLGLALTKMYGLVNDPGVRDTADADVARLRWIHRGLDETIMAAYGWNDFSLDYGFHVYRQVNRWTVGPTARVEILNRLLEENHRRAASRAQ